ncbi:MAG: EamA family transporter [Alphaproteobacteria bacterium]|nr:EamA family transporter [Alphaproteobacteria bacterium]
MAPQHFLLLLLICTIWGFNFVAAKVGVSEVPPLLFAGLRFAILFVLLIPFLKVAPGRMRDVVMIALFNGAIHFGLMFIGVALTAASVMAVIVQLNVPFATMLSIVMLGEVVHWRRWTGIAMTFFGVMIVSFDPHVFDSLTGVLFGAAAALSGAIAAIYMRRLTNVGVFQLQSWTAAVTAPCLLLASLAFETGQLDAIGNASWIAWGALLFTAFGASLIGHNGYYYLLQRYEVSLIAPLSLLAPILGVVFGIWVLGEPMTARIVLGALTAFVGVAILAIRNRRPIENEI